MSILVFGTGSIGTTLGAWLAEVRDDVVLFSRGQAAEVLAGRGAEVYRRDAPEPPRRVSVRVETDLAAVGAPEVVFLTVKNYQLVEAADAIHEALGDGPIVVGLQNGAENQEVLPARFSRVVFAIASYNAWLDGPGVAGYQKKGPIVIAAREGGRPRDAGTGSTRSSAPRSPPSGPTPSTTPSTPSWS